jgi:hypothetical protein
MNTSLFRARLDAEFLLPLLTVGWSCLYRPDEPVNLDDLLYDVIDSDEEWRRVERLSAAYLYSQVATAEVTLVRVEWDGPVVPVHGAVYLANFGLRKTFVVMRPRVGPNLVVAAYRGLDSDDMLRRCVDSMLSHGAEWYPEELFDELPARTINRRPDLLPRQLLLDGYCAFAERVLGESERVLVEVYFESTYAEEPPPVPAPTPSP